MFASPGPGAASGDRHAASSRPGPTYGTLGRWSPVRYAWVLGLRMAYREAGAATPSSSCTATPRRRTCGATSSAGSPTAAGAWRRTWWAWAPRTSCPAPGRTATGSSSTAATSTPCSTSSACSDRVVLVGHDWGGVLAIDWARRHPGAVRGIAYLETLVAPVSWTGANAPDPALFGPLRGPDGERLVLVENVFVEKVLPAGTLRRLTDDEMDAYRAPYRDPGESRRPTLTWPREIPIDGDPADVAEIVTRNAEWMASSPVPKLFVNGDPGALLTGPCASSAAGGPRSTRSPCRACTSCRRTPHPRSPMRWTHWLSRLG